MGFLIYLLGVVDSIGCALIGFGIFLGIVTLILTIITGIEFADHVPKHRYSDDEEKETPPYETIGKFAKRTGLACVICIGGAAFLPSSQTLAAMYLIPKVAHNEQVKQIPSKALKILNLKLDEWVDDLAKKESKEEPKE